MDSTLPLDLELVPIRRSKRPEVMHFDNALAKVQRRCDEKSYVLATYDAK